MGDILEITTVGDLVLNKGRMISVPDTATIMEVLNTLSANNITAVPVAACGKDWLGAGGTSIKDGGTQYIGFVSILDVVLHIADNLGQPEKEMGLLAVNIIGQSNESRTLWTLSPTTKLLQAMEPLSKGIHRFLVPFHGLAEPEDEPGPEINVSASKFGLLTQTDVVRFFLQNIDYLGPVAAKTVADLDVVEAGQSPVAVPSNMPLVDVLRLMRHVGALAVVGPMDGITPGSQPRPVRGGKVLGTISASDFRGLRPETLRSLTDVTVEQFLTSSSRVDAPKAPVTCRLNTPLATVMATAIASKVHRVWVTNEDGWLSGVVAFSDIISAIRQQDRQAVANS